MLLSFDHIFIINSLIGQLYRKKFKRKVVTCYTSPAVGPYHPSKYQAIVVNLSTFLFLIKARDTHLFEFKWLLLSPC